MAAAAPLPIFRTVAERVNVEPAIGLVSLTENVVTTRLPATVTLTDDEQLFVVSDSSANCIHGTRRSSRCLGLTAH